MKTARFFKGLLIAVLILAAGTFLFFHRMYRNDLKALRAFIASYQAYDKAILAYGQGGRAEDLAQASANLRRLQALASMRISSLIRSDGELMDQAREIADLAGMEFEDYRSSSADPAAMAKKSEQGRPNRLNSERRQAAWDRFEDLAGRKGDDYER